MKLTKERIKLVLSYRFCGLKGQIFLCFQSISAQSNKNFLGDIKMLNNKLGCLSKRAVLLCRKFSLPQ